MGITTKECGRELMVQFTCSRCKETDILPYDAVMKGEYYKYLRNSLLPNGWEMHSYLGHLFCQKCNRAYRVFMGYAKEG